MQELLTAHIYSEGTPKARASRHRAVARLLREKGLFENAERELRTAEELDPENANTKLDLASLLEAEELFLKLLVLNPDPARTHFYLGRIYEQKGDKDKALMHYREALTRYIEDEED